MNRIRTSRSHSFFFLLCPHEKRNGKHGRGKFSWRNCRPHCPNETARAEIREQLNVNFPRQPSRDTRRGNKKRDWCARDGFGWTIYRTILSFPLSFSLSPENERKERATVEKEGLKTRSNRQLLHDEWMGNGRSMDRLGNCVFLPAILLETSLEFLLLYTRLFIKCVLPSSARVFPLELRGKIVD